MESTVSTGLLRPAEAAAYLAVSLRQLRRFVNEGPEQDRLAVVSYSLRSYRLRQEDLDAWVDAGFGRS